jgi:hypothetical protein
LFSSGDRVRVSDDFFWAKGATGTVSAPPDAVTSLSGAWDSGLKRQEVSALGTTPFIGCGSTNRSSMLTVTAHTAAIKSGKLLYVC